MNPTEPNVPAIRQRRPMTEARLKANRENAKKAALSGRSGRPRGSVDGNRLSLRERCRVRDEEHVATLERIAADDSHPGLMDRGFEERQLHVIPRGQKKSSTLDVWSAYRPTYSVNRQT